MKENNQNQDSKLTVYELALLVDPKLSEDAVNKKVDKLGDIVAQGSGAVLSSGESRMRNLAYEITIKNEGKRRDFTKAYFNWIKFEQSPDLLGSIETTLSADSEIIRFLIVKTTREDYVTTLTDEYNPEDDIDEDDIEEGDDIILISEDDIESDDEDDSDTKEN